MPVLARRARRVLAGTVATALATAVGAPVAVGAPGAGAAAGAAAQAAGPVVAVPDSDLVPGATVEVTATAAGGTALTVAQCVRPVAPTRADSQCGPGVAGTVGPGGTAVVPLVVAADVPAVGPDEPTACRAANCAVAAFDAAGALVGDWGIAMAPVPVTVTLDRTAGLIDGDRVLAEATGLDPGGAYVLLRCDDVGSAAPACESPPPGPTIVASPSGRLAASVTVTQRFSEPAGHHVCRRECGVGVAVPGSPDPLAVVGYGLADGDLAAAPSTGLADGQPVTLTGTGLMAGYVGPGAWIFPATGGWGIAQCAVAVLDDPSVAGVFRHCAGVPGAGPVEVPVSDVTLTAPAQAALTTVLGDPVDCTQAPGACAFVLTRLEQDATVTLHAAPLTFA